MIDAASPLHGADDASLRADKAEFIVVMGGTDSTVVSRVHARHSYTPDEIAWDRYYADVIFPEADGRWVIDYDRFHTLRPERRAEGAR